MSISIDESGNISGVTKFNLDANDEIVSVDSYFMLDDTVAFADQDLAAIQALDETSATPMYDKTKVTNVSGGWKPGDEYLD